MRKDEEARRRERVRQGGRERRLVGNVAQGVEREREGGWPWVHAHVAPFTRRAVMVQLKQLGETAACNFWFEARSS